jgi:hypothetical protein
VLLAKSRYRTEESPAHSHCLCFLSEPHSSAFLTTLSSARRRLSSFATVDVNTAYAQLRSLPSSRQPYCTSRDGFAQRKEMKKKRGPNGHDGAAFSIAEVGRDECSAGSADANLQG